MTNELTNKYLGKTAGGWMKHVEIIEMMGDNEVVAILSGISCLATIDIDDHKNMIITDISGFAARLPMSNRAYHKLSDMLKKLNR